MKRRSLWQLSVASTPAAEETVGSLLAETFGTPAAIHFDAREGTTRVSVFLERRPADLAQRSAVFRAGLRLLAERGWELGSGRLTLRRLPAQDWAESWKRHFRPCEFGRALLVKPSWSRRRARQGQAVVVLDPGLSFGTGQHPTTHFCLRQLVARRPAGLRRSFLDVGTGSGILGIAAAKLGYAPAHAFDHDPDAVRVARANARRNGVSSTLRIRCEDLAGRPTPPTRRYDLVCANLTANLLRAERRKVAGLVGWGGVLILAGILRTEFAQVQAAYVALGFRLAASRTEGEWRSGAFTFAG